MLCVILTTVEYALLLRRVGFDRQYGRHAATLRPAAMMLGVMMPKSPENQDFESQGA